MRRHQSILTIIFIVALSLPACSGRKSVVTSPKARAASASESSSPTALSEYIRTVLKISQENTAATEEALKRLHERRPDLAALVGQINENPDDLSARRLLAAAYMSEGLYHYAFPLYQEIRLRDPGNPVAELATSRIWYQWGDYSLARQHAEQALVLYPQLVGAHELLGRIHLQRNEPDAAIYSLLSAARFEPRNAALMADVGYAYFVKADLKSARHYLEKAVLFEPSLIEARNNLGVVLGHLGDYGGALQEFTAANGRAAAFNNLGAVYLAQRRWDDARGAFRQALALDPENAKARENLAEVESRMPPPTVVDLPSFPEAPGPETSKQPERARPVVRTAPAIHQRRRGVRIAAAYEDALNRFGNRRYRQAIAILSWLLEQDADHVLASNWHYWIGESYFGLGRYGEAKAAFKRVADYPNSPKKRDALQMIRRSEAKARQRAGKA